VAHGHITGWFFWQGGQHERDIAAHTRHRPPIGAHGTWVEISLEPGLLSDLYMLGFTLACLVFCTRSRQKHASLLSGRSLIGHVRFFVYSALIADPAGIDQLGARAPFPGSSALGARRANRRHTVLPPRSHVFPEQTRPCFLPEPTTDRPEDVCISPHIVADIPGWSAHA